MCNFRTIKGFKGEIEFEKIIAHQWSRYESQDLKLHALERTFFKACSFFTYSVHKIFEAKDLF
jgi:hypothetical protein